MPDKTENEKAKPGIIAIILIAVVSVIAVLNGQPRLVLQRMVTKETNWLGEERNYPRASKQ